MDDSGLVFGTPITAGTFKVSAKAESIVGSDVKELSVVIRPAVIPPEIVTSSLPECVVKTTYSQALSASGTTPITWAIELGGLPPGMSLNPNTGVISGTPIMNGTFRFLIKAENSADSDIKELSISIGGYIIVPPLPTPPIGYVDAPYSYTITPPANMMLPIVWSLSGSLPPGLKLNADTGEISGAPKMAGEFNPMVIARNNAAACTINIKIQIKEQL
jgi:hypothetical protein